MGRRAALLNDLVAGAYQVVLPAVAAFLLLASVTGWVWRNAEREVRHRAEERFSFKVAETKEAVQQRLQAYEQVLRGSTAMLAATGRVSRDDWRIYVQQLALEQHFPGIQAIAYAVRLTPEQIADYQATVRAEGFGDFAIRPAGARSEYVVVHYIEPFEWRNRRAFGFDLASEPVRREALNLARDQGRPAVTGKITLAQENGQAMQRGLLLCSPLFPGGVVPPTVEERRASLIGYVNGVFRMNDLMRGIFGAAKLPDVRIEIFDGAEALQSALLYDSEEGADTGGAIPAAMTEYRNIEFGGRRWTLRLRSTPAFMAGIDSQKPRILLFGGLLISLMFAWIVGTARQSRLRAHEIAVANQGLERLTRDLQLAKTAAEAANAAKGEFLANVSHEVRTPLTLILAPLEQLSRGNTPPPDWRHQLARIERNALVLLDRVNELLDFSKAEAGRLDVRWAPMAPTRHLAPLISDAAEVARDKGCTLSWWIDPQLESIETDAAHLQTIVLNLLSNALKFTPSGGNIELRMEAVDAGWFELCVSDTGIGIPAASMPLLFERFSQLDASPTRQYGGTGIGLALVRRLVEVLGGDIRVSSEPAQGTRFTTRLPRQRPQGVALATSVAPAEHAMANVYQLQRIRLAHNAGANLLAVPAAGGSADGNPRVLVAEDNADMLEYVAGMLAPECHVTAVSDGEQAWQILQREPVDAVVSDVMMPNLDGTALAKRMKADPRLACVPIILVTARGGSDACVAGLDSGADDYVSKPFSPEELKARVHAALRMGRVQAEMRELAREAGKSLVAAGVLHDLGNLFNGISALAAVINAGADQRLVGALRDLAQALQSLPLPAHATELPRLVEHLAEQTDIHRQKWAADMAALRERIAHAVSLIESQRSVACPGLRFPEPLSLTELADTALQLSANVLDAAGVQVIRQRDDVCTGMADRHITLQILLSLLGNALAALAMKPAEQRRITVRTRGSGARVFIDVADTGCGIDPERQAELFQQSFAARGDGYHYDLHRSALWAQDMGGELYCQSDGPGLGATFTLALPCPPRQAEGHSQVADATAAGE